MIVVWLCAFPSKCRGGCAIGFVGIPLSVEVIVVVWLSAHLSKCGGDCCCAIASCVEVVFVGERICLLLVCITQILSGGFLCEKSCVDDIVKILLCEGGDVEQWLEPRNISWCLRLIHYL